MSSGRVDTGAQIEWNPLGIFMAGSGITSGLQPIFGGALGPDMYRLDYASIDLVYSELDNNASAWMCFWDGATEFHFLQAACHSPGVSIPLDYNAATKDTGQLTLPFCFQPGLAICGNGESHTHGGSSWTALVAISAGYGVYS